MKMQNPYSFIITIANVVIGITWLYHGIVPKLLFMQTGELGMIQSSGLFKGMEPQTVYTIGVLEVLFGLAVLFFGRYNILHYLSIAGLCCLGIGAFIIKPDVYIQPFNPVTTSLGVIGLSFIVLRIKKNMPAKY